MPTLDQLRTQVSETKNKLEDSKILSPEERLTKATELEITVSQIKKDLDSLKQGATPDKSQEIELLELEYNALQNQLNIFKEELQSFQENLVSDIENEVKEELKQEEKSDNKKGWLGRQFEGLTSKEEWQSNPGKNVARIAGGVGAIWLGSKIIKGIGRLFKGKNKDKSDSDSKEKSKKPRYKKRRGIGLIGIGSFLGIRWLTTGRNPFDWGGPGLSEPPEKQLASYVDLAKDSPEKFQKYQDIGANVNDIYSKVYEKEINSGWKDVDALGKIGLEHSQEVKGSNPDIVYSGLVPYVMDRNFSSVGKMISPEGLMYQERSSDLEYLKKKILSRGKEKISGLLGPILGSLQSWISLGNKSGESIEDKFSRWAESGDPEDRLNELQFFFRQYMKVNTYLICKKDEIAISIAKEKFETNHGSFDSYEDAMENEEWFKQNIEKDKRYKDFISGKLVDVSKNIESAGVSVTSLSQEIEEQVSDLDEQRDEMLHFDDNKDILDIADQEVESGGLTDTTKNKLSKSCDSMLEDIHEEVEEAVKESCWDPYSKLLNTAGANKQEFIEKSGLEDLFGNLKGAIREYQDKIKNGSVTKEDYKNFKELTNSYFALKKEMIIGSQTLQEINDGKNPLWAVAGFLWGCIGNLGTAVQKLLGGNILEGTGYLLTGIAPVMAIREGWLCLTKSGHGLKRIKQVGNITVGLPKKLIQSNMWIAKQVAGKYVGSPRALRGIMFAGENGPAKLERVLKNGKISLDKAAEVIWHGRRSQLILSRKVKDAWGKFDGASPYLIKEQLVKKLIPGLGEADLGLAVKYYDNKTLGAVLRGPDGINVIKKIDKSIGDLPLAKQQYILDVLHNKKLGAGQIDDLIKNIDQIDIAKISPKAVAKGLGKRSTVSDIMVKQINKIDEVTKTKFTNLIEKEVSEMSKISDSRIMQGKIQRLRNLKNSNELTQESAEMFVKLDSKGIKARHFPDISDLLRSDSKVARALSKGDFAEFARLARAKNLPHISAIVDDLTSILKRGAKYVDDIADIAKSIGRLAKLL